jgi:hypothetical protein
MSLRRTATRTASNSNLRPYAGFRDPQSVAGLLAWYDLSDSSMLATSHNGTGAVTSGSAVGYAADMSGNGWHLTQSTANNRPTWNGSLNSKTVLTFDGTNDMLSSSSAWPLAGNPAWTLFVVHTRATTTSGNPLSWGTRAAGNVSVNDDHIGRWGLAGSNYFQTVVNTTTNAAQLISAIKPSGRAHLCTTYRSGAYSVGGFAGLTTGLGSVAAGVFNLGRTVSGPSQHNGTVAEVLVYSRALTETEHQDVVVWLGGRWGVTIT